jgi:hypothetical protein
LNSENLYFIFKIMVITILKNLGQDPAIGKSLDTDTDPYDQLVPTNVVNPYPDWIRIRPLDSDTQSGSGSKRAKKWSTEIENS